MIEETLRWCLVIIEFRLSSHYALVKDILFSIYFVLVNTWPRSCFNSWKLLSFVIPIQKAGRPIMIRLPASLGGSQEETAPSEGRAQGKSSQWGACCALRGESCLRADTATHPSCLGLSLEPNPPRSTTLRGTKMWSERAHSHCISCEAQHWEGRMLDACATLWQGLGIWRMYCHFTRYTDSSLKKTS